MSALRWHAPTFAAWGCARGTITDRERLGLPDRFHETDLQSAVTRDTAALRQAPVAVLLRVIAGADATLPARIAAGNLLALAGDPRIDPLAPAMCDVPGGTVYIGLDPARIDAVTDAFADLGIDRGWIAKEAPRHAVTLAPYRIARFPVTNAEYRLFLTETGHPGLPGSWAFRRYPAERGNHPVYTVGATDADAYAAWLAARTGRGFRLPSEAEWEHAAAGPHGRTYPWGDLWDPARANTCECGLLDTAPVGAFAGGAAWCGALDMGGNVEEYVADDYAAYPGGAVVTDDLAQIHGTYRMARGGAFSRFRDLARTRRRHGHNPRSATYAMGFRLAESL